MQILQHADTLRSVDLSDVENAATLAAISQRSSSSSNGDVRRRPNATSITLYSPAAAGWSKVCLVANYHVLHIIMYALVSLCLR